MCFRALVLALILAAAPAFARSHPSSHSSRSHRLSSTGRHSAARCSGCARDRRGRIKRSAAARDAFRRANPCPSTGRTSGRCPGYVIDHIRALKHGGSDTPGNMQWQTRAAARAKDRVE